MPEKLQEQFNAAMFDIYRRSKLEAGYHATLFLQMLTRDGGLATAKKLINAPHQSDGYTALFLENRLDLTVEALVLDNSKWWPLFADEEIAAARKRLSSNGYEPRD